MVAENQKKAVGDRFKKARAALGLTQKELFALVGIPVPSLQDYEAGKRMPGGEAVSALIGAGINANWLLTGDGSMLLADMQAIPSGALDMHRLQRALQASETGLSESQRYMAPDKKAELVLAVYEWLEEADVDEERLLNIIKLVA